jgi:hypothetical protein
LEIIVLEQTTCLFSLYTHRIINKWWKHYESLEVFNCDQKTPTNPRFRFCNTIIPVFRCVSSF